MLERVSLLLLHERDQILSEIVRKRSNWSFLNLPVDLVVCLFQRSVHVALSPWAYFHVVRTLRLLYIVMHIKRDRPPFVFSSWCLFTAHSTVFCPIHSPQNTLVSFPSLRICLDNRLAVLLLKRSI